MSVTLGLSITCISDSWWQSGQLESLHAKGVFRVGRVYRNVHRNSCEKLEAAEIHRRKSAHINSYKQIGAAGKVLETELNVSTRINLQNIQLSWKRKL